MMAGNRSGKLVGSLTQEFGASDATFNISQTVPDLKFVDRPIGHVVRHLNYTHTMFKAIWGRDEGDLSSVGAACL